jgi:hypothetical protein
LEEGQISEKSTGKAAKKREEQERKKEESDEDNESEDKATPLVGQKDSKGRPKLNIPSMDKALIDARRKRDAKRNLQRKKEVKGAEAAATRFKKTQADTRTKNLGSIMPQRTEIKRYSLRVSIPTNKDPDAIIRNQLITIFRKLQEMDPKLVIYPWDLRKSRNLPVTIENLAKMPKGMDKLKVYFPEIGRRYKSGYMSLSVLLGHNKQIREVTGPIFSWLKAENHGLWQRHLQVEKATRGGWLAYCYPGMDKNLLAEEIQSKIGFKVGLEWKQIYSGQRVSRENAIYAFHVEIDIAEYDECHAALLNMYGRQSTAAEMPFGIRMRLIPEIESALTKKGKDKVLSYRIRHKGFMDNMMKAWSPDLDNIDVKESAWGGATLRHMIMNLRNPERPSYSLFHSIQKTAAEFTNDGEPQFRFLFIPEAKQLALSVIATPLTYLRFMYSDQETEAVDKFDDYFNDAAKIRAAKLKWNRETGEAVSEADTQLYGYDPDEDEDMMFDFTEAEGNLNVIATKDPPKAPSKLDPMRGSPSLDSVSEFEPTTAKKPSRVKHPNDSDSVAASTLDSDQESKSDTDKEEGLEEDTYDLTGVDDHSTQSMTLASMQESIQETVAELVSETEERLMEVIERGNKASLEQMNNNVQEQLAKFLGQLSSPTARNVDAMDTITAGAAAQHGTGNP